MLHYCRYFTFELSKLKEKINSDKYFDTEGVSNFQANQVLLV
jgi:hypothetical protein